MRPHALLLPQSDLEVHPVQISSDHTREGGKPRHCPLVILRCYGFALSCSLQETHSKNTKKRKRKRKSNTMNTFLKCSTVRETASRAGSIGLPASRYRTKSTSNHFDLSTVAFFLNQIFDKTYFQLTFPGQFSFYGDHFKNEHGFFKFLNVIFSHSFDEY